MSYQNFIKSVFNTKSITEILNEKPSALLGVTSDCASLLSNLNIKTVFDLGVSNIFSNAFRVLNAGEEIGSIFRKAGRFPSSIIDDRISNLTDVAFIQEIDLSQLVGLDADITINGVTKPIGDFLQSELNINTIRDLALWPPYISAKKIVIESLNPEIEIIEDPEAPNELIPRSGEFATEKHLYSSLVMLKGDTLATTPINNSLFDISASPQVGFDKVRFGGLLTFSQSWFPRHVSKGHLLHSLALAPGESTNVAVIDWTNKSNASTQQSLSEAEKLSSTMDRARSINEISKSVANEFQSGSSVSGTQSSSVSAGGAGLLFGFPEGIISGGASGSANETTSATHTTSDGRRDISTDLTQNINDSTHQASSSLRSQKAAVVSEVSQSDSEHLSTRTVTNYNHMHAMSIQYYEVVQIYETEVKLEDCQRCIFIPMELIDFTDERNIFKYLDTLQRVALDDTTRILLDDMLDAGGYEFKFSGERFKDISTLSPAIQTNFNQLIIQLHQLNDRNFINLNLFNDGNNDTKKVDDFGLNFQLQLNNVKWDVTNNITRSIISRIQIFFEDNSISPITINNPSPSNTSPDEINSRFNGGNSSLSFGKIKTIRIELSPGLYSGNGTFVSFALAVKLNGVSKWMNCSFAIPKGLRISRRNYRKTFSVKTIPEINELINLLMENQLYYSQQIWKRLNPQEFVMQIAPLEYQITPGAPSIKLVDYINPVPFKIIGNYVVYKFSFDKDLVKEIVKGEPNLYYNEDSAYYQFYSKLDRSNVNADSVAVPTGGVFAEAVLGRFNAAEKIDVTRFFNWQDSPPLIKPPAIADLKAGNHELAQAPGQTQFDKPIVNIQNPIALPDPTGMSAVLNAITSANIFRDMSGSKTTGDIGTAATEAAGANSIGALQQAGLGLANSLSAMTQLMQTLTSKDSLKTISDVGALLNKKSDIAKQKEEVNSSDSQNTESLGGGNSISDNDASSNNADSQEKIVENALDGTGFGTPKKDLLASNNPQFLPDVISNSSDSALLNSKLITEPLFTDVTGFVLLLELIDDDSLINVLIRRFDTLDSTINPISKYNELLDEIRTRSSFLTNPEKLIFAVEFIKTSVLPDSAFFSESIIKRVKDSAISIMSKRAFEVAKSVNNSFQTISILESIFNQCFNFGIKDINHVAYILATAHHETAMGKFMEEIANGISTNTVFTKDAYFFNRIPNLKASYNGINGNLFAGDQLGDSNDINTAGDIALWNGNVYPDAQPDSIKISARACDFYRYIGRGLVQLTGRDNYNKFSNLSELNLEDFEANPEKVIELENASIIIVMGMKDGMFSHNKSLEDYDIGGTFDAFNARDIINADKAKNGDRIRQFANRYKDSLIIFTNLDESKAIV